MYCTFTVGNKNYSKNLGNTFLKSTYTHISHQSLMIKPPYIFILSYSENCIHMSFTCCKNGRKGWELEVHEFGQNE